MARLQDISPIANSDYLITIEGLTGIYWTQFSGVKASYKRATYNDGLSNVTRMTEGGVKEYQNVTISKPYDPVKDQPALDFIKSKENGEVFDVRLKPVRRVTNASGATEEVRGTKSWDLSGCRIVSWACADGVDTSDGSKPSMLEIEFSIEEADFK